MSARTQGLFASVRTEGALLPAEWLARLIDPAAGLQGLRPQDYHLAPGERLSDAVNRSWNRLLGVWSGLRAAAEKLPENALGTALTRERWLLLLFQELGYGRLQREKAIVIGDKSYPISHGWQLTPIHLLGLRVDLDRRLPGLAGAARSSPHSLVQELLNRSDDHLWALLSNGLKLRILRDNASLTRQAYVEFDLEAIMDGELYADFRLLWLLCHQSRVEGERPEQCWLERWSQQAREQGTRALDHLREGVEAAITALGQGLLAHPANRALRERLSSGALSTQDYYRELLRLVYRLIFLFVAEDRDLLMDPAAPQEARDRYQRYYSTARLRRLAEGLRGGRHDDLYQGLKVVMTRLYESGCPALALPALGSFLWSPNALAHLNEARIGNRDLLQAIRALAYIRRERTLQAVDYRNLGAEELGSIYESLLELHSELNTAAGIFALRIAAGHERKTTGSYYTPESLIKELLDSALDPVLAEAAAKPDPERAILALKVCDPATGSGHFLVAAAHRIARCLAAVRTGDEEPAPAEIHHALRDVVSHCLYGVDLNPMAVELCKVSLWMTAMEPGKPLSFLDHRILCGNSLLGATPALIAQGIPDAAFKPIEGDDKACCTEFKRQNKRERESRMDELFGYAMPWERLGNLAAAVSAMEDVADDHINGVRERQARYQALVKGDDYLYGRLLADAWCAAFVWRKRRDLKLPMAITEGLLRKIEENPHHCLPWMRQAIRRLAERYRFFHWHLAFPDVFRLPAACEKSDNERTGWSGGFDVVLGNPPWERIKLQEKEWFAARSPEIASAPNAAARKRLIAKLEQQDPALFAAFREDLRQAEGESHLVRDTNRYPLCGRGDVNTYAVFAELNRQLIAPTGRVGCIVPSGIATDDTTKFFFQDLVERRALASLYDFENRGAIFPGVHRSYKFCLLTLSGPARPVAAAEFVFFAHQPEDLTDPERRFTLSAEDIRLLNPNTRTCPIFRTRRDAEITKTIYRRVPVLIQEIPPNPPLLKGGTDCRSRRGIEYLPQSTLQKGGGEAGGIFDGNPWGISFLRMFDMSNDSHLFRTREQLEAEGWRLVGNVFEQEGKRYLPLYEAKMIHQFDHRWASYEGLETHDLTAAEKDDPNCLVMPRYWVPEDEVADAMQGKWEKSWLLGFRRVARTTDERSAIFTILPWVGAGDSVFLMLSGEGRGEYKALVAVLDSLAFDYVVRQKVGGMNFNFFIVQQLPVLPPKKYEEPCGWYQNAKFSEWFCPRVLELTYTAWDLQPFARDCGYDGPPFRWDEERRFLLRCELDAAFFHLYGIARDVDYILETFPIVRRKDEARYGEYRTKRVILEIYDAMQQALETGEPYRTLLDPPPGDSRVAHTESKKVIEGA